MFDFNLKGFIRSNCTGLVFGMIFLEMVFALNEYFNTVSELPLENNAALRVLSIPLLL